MLFIYSDIYVHCFLYHCFVVRLVALLLSFPHTHTAEAQVHTTAEFLECLGLTLGVALQTLILAYMCIYVVLVFGVLSP